MFLARSARILWMVLIVATTIQTGCGRRVNLAPSDDPDAITPPASAGNVDQLLGTSWEFTSLDMVVSFYGDGGSMTSPVASEDAPSADMLTARLSNPTNPEESMTAYWRLRANGVISLSFIGNTRAGTWDGQRLVLGGEEGVFVGSP